MKSTTLAVAVAVALIATVHCAPPANDSAANAQRIGTWSNVRVTEGDDPHAYGIAIEIWRHNREFAGFLTEYVGPAFDPPIGRLESIELDEATGALSFTSKLSVGVVRSAQDDSWEPARNLYEFKGIIDEQRGSLTGSLRRKHLDDNGAEATGEQSIALEGHMPGGDRARNLFLLE